MVAALFFGVASTLAAGEVDTAIIPLAYDEQDPRLPPIARTVEQTLEVVLGLLPGYRVEALERDSAPDREGARSAAEAQALGLVVFGGIEARDPSGYRLSFSVYDFVEDAVVLELERDADALIDIFSVADELTAEVAAEVLGEAVAFGSIALRPAGYNLGYRVELGESLVSDAPREIDPVLTGEHRVRVVLERNEQSELVVFDQEVSVREGERTEVGFYLPALSAAERRGLTEIESELLDAHSRGELSEHTEERWFEADPAGEAVGIVQSMLHAGLSYDERATMMARVVGRPGALPDGAGEADPAAVVSALGESAELLGLRGGAAQPITAGRGARRAGMLDPRPFFPDPTAATELAERVYPWHRHERLGQRLYSVSFYSGRETRPGDWPSSPGVLGLRARMDWGERHSVTLGYESSIGEIVEPDEGANGDPYRFDETEGEGSISFEPYEIQRLYLGYGRRYRPFRNLTVIPGLRAGLEREARLAFTEVDGTRLATANPDGALFDSDYEYGDTFWVGSLGPEVTAELHWRRLTASGSVGLLGFLPFESEYEQTLEGEGGAGPFEVSQTITRSYALTWALGLGYSWGGDEERAEPLRPEPRRYVAYPEAERRPWGLSLVPGLGFSHAVAPGFSEGLLRLPEYHLGLEYARGTGMAARLSVTALNTPAQRSTQVLSADQDSVPDDTEGTFVLNRWFTSDLALGRRLALSDRWFVKPAYRQGFTVEDVQLESDAGTFSSNTMVLYRGPEVNLEYSVPGTSAVVFSRAALDVAGPLGGGDYAFGFGDEITVDGYAQAPPRLRTELGALIRLGGTPARMLAEDAPAGEWLSYSGFGLGRNARQDGNRYAPRMATGFGLEVLGGAQDMLGVQAVFPFTLRFPFGLEFGLQASSPLTAGGIAGDRRQYEFYDEPASFDGVEEERFTAEPRFNRAFSLELGYRFFRTRRFSIRPGIRYTTIDYELWNIENELEDGTVISGEDSRFSREGTVQYLGGVAELAFAASDRVTVTLNGGFMVLGSEDSYGIPMYSSEVVYEYPENHFFSGVAAHVEM